MHSFHGFAKFGLSAFLLEKVDKEIIQPYYRVFREAKASQKPGQLMTAFQDVINNPKIKKATAVRLKHNLPEATEGVFFGAVRNVPESDIPRLAEIIVNSELFGMLNDVSGCKTQLFKELVERCPENEKSVLFSIIGR